MRIPNVVTVVYDSAEKSRLLFPSILAFRSGLKGKGRSIRIRLTKKCLRPCGADYLIEGFQHVTAAERKGAASELATNLATRDHGRQLRSFDKLIQHTAHPILALDFPMSEMWSSYLRKPGDLILDRLFGAAALGGMHILWMGSRSRLPTRRVRKGELLLRLMLHLIDRHTED